MRERLYLEVGEGGVTRRYKVGRSSASPPAEGTTEVSWSKVEAKGSQKHPSPKVLKLIKGYFA